MRRLGSAVRFLLLLAAAVLVCLCVAASADAAEGVSIAPAPAWVLPLAESEWRDAEPDGGIAVRAADEQTRAVGGEVVVFRRGVLTVTNEQGTAVVGRRMYEFTPPHQRLVLHRLDLVRGKGPATSVLRADRIDVLRRELGMEGGVLDGRRTAVVLLSDVRVGDTLVYEYSIVGENPVFAGHSSPTWLLASSVPLGMLRFRLVTDRELRPRALGGAAPLEAVRLAPLKEYVYAATDVAAVPSEPGWPDDHRPYPSITFSDFRSWPEVGAWARTQLSPPTTGAKVAAWVADLRLVPGEEPRVVAALRKVQDGIRYVSLALGAGTHRAAPPERVIERGFGDCKDKSVLLAGLLTSLGYDADVVLVDSNGGRTLREQQPSIGAFDHAVVRLRLGGKRWLLDPTRDSQRGRLSDVIARNFHWALPAAKEPEELFQPDLPDDDRPDAHHQLVYRIEAIPGPTTLVAKSTYTREWAESIRRLKAGATARQLDEDLGAEVLRAYPSGVRTEPLDVQDQPEVNEITVRQVFSLEKEWEHDPPTFLVVPPGRGSMLPAAKPERKSPLGLPHPLRLVFVSEIRVAGGLTDSPSDDVVEDSGFVLRREVKPSIAGSPAYVVARDELFLKSHRVETAQLRDYSTARMKAIRAMEYTIVRREQVAPSFPFAPYGASLAAVVVAAALMIVADRRRAWVSLAQVEWNPKLAGLRGWLAVLGIGVCCGPLAAGFSLWQSRFALTTQGWTAIRSSVDASTRVPLLHAELVVYAANLVVSIFLVRWYFRRHPSFPIAEIAATAGLVVFTLLDQLAVGSLLPAEPGAKANVGAPAGFVGAVIRILYLCYSKRVRATFGPPPFDASDEAPAEAAPRRKRRKKPSTRRAPPED